MNSKTSILAVAIHSLISFMFIFFYRLTVPSESLGILPITFMILLVIPFWWIGILIDKLRFHSQQSSVQVTRLQQIFDNVDALIWENDIIHEKISISKGIEKMFGIPREHIEGDYSLWMKCIHPDDRGYVDQYLKRLVSGEYSQGEWRFISADGGILWVETRGTPIFNERGEVIKLIGVMLDITNQKVKETMLIESEERYRSVVEMSPQMIVIHQEGKIAYANPTVLTVMGVIHTESLINRNMYDFIHPSDVVKAVTHTEEIQSGVQNHRFREYRIIRPDGKVLYLEMLGTPITYNRQPAILVVGKDVTERKKYEEKMKQMAYYDGLTGLPNRYMIKEYLRKALIRCKKENKKLAVLFLDLDRFKMVNDTMGHEMGDLLLIKVTKRIKACLRKKDRIARQGGDEFIVVLEDIVQGDAQQMAQRIISALSMPFVLNGEEFFISPSIGISLYPEDGTTSETLIKNADKTMYLVKEHGKNNYQFSISEPEDQMARKVKLESRLRKALKNKEFFLEYQPQVELATGEIKGVEALIRWNHPELGLIPPFEFIPLAEEIGVIVDIGKWVMQTACRQNKEWQKAGFAPLRMAVNVSPKQLKGHQFVDTVKKVLEETKLDPQWLELEITESLMQNVKESCLLLNQLKKTGIKISIDDFGTGYSSLNILNQLPIDYIKIDQSFIRDISVDPNMAAIVKTIIDMAKNLRFSLIAEGIESEEHVAFLRENGCQLGQGYFYSRPVSAEMVETLFHHSRLLQLS